MRQIINRLRINTIILVGLLTFAGWLPSCWATQKVVPAPGLLPQGYQLTVLDNHHAPSNAVFNGNSLSPQTVEPLEHTFTLRNDTHAALALDYLKTSCTCTTASLEGTSDGATIAPGGTFSVRVSIDPLRLVPGLLHKSVWVFVQGQDAPAATLEMTGALLPAVSFSPPSLSFGRIEKGTELTLLLRMTSQTTRMEQGSELRLISADPDLSVTEVPPDASNAAGEAMPMTRAFRVRLAPHAHVGRLQGQLSLILAHTGDPSDATGPVVNTISWRGDAAGKIAANPQVVAFGITTGQEVVRKIMLSGPALGNSSKPFTLSSTNPYVTATLEPLPSRTATKLTTPIGPNPSGQAANSQMEVDVHLDKHVPIGPLDARVTVTTADGEQLVLPVFAVVQPAPKPAP